jgi:hypothetical protein
VFRKSSEGVVEDRTVQKFQKAVEIERNSRARRPAGQPASPAWTFDLGQEEESIQMATEEFKFNGH